jgi:hypothetical protein
MYLRAGTTRYIKEGICPVIHGIQATAVVGILDKHNVIRLLRLVKLVPFIVDEESERGGGHDAFEE